MDPCKAAEASHSGMGTHIFHKVFGPDANRVLHAAKKEIVRLERLFSRFLPRSDVSKINRSAGVKPEAVSPETFMLLNAAKEYSALFQGAFDITIGPLVDLWDYKHAKGIPEETKLKNALSLVNYKGLMLDERFCTAMLEKSSQSVDLGGVGKGYASDRFVDVFRKYGITSAFTNIGGNVSTLGSKPDGSPWRVGIRHPRLQSALLGAVDVADDSVVTSGDYERYFIDPTGKRRHHILDPATGYPAESQLISVTVIAKSAMTADALSTAIFVAGMRKGLGFLARFPGAQAVLVDANLTVYVTPGLKDSFQAESGIQVNILH